MELLTHKDDRWEYTYYLKDNEEIFHGLYKHWYSNGQLSCKRSYKDGRQHGFSIGWCSDGQLEYEEYYWEGVEYESKEAYEEAQLVNKAW